MVCGEGSGGEVSEGWGVLEPGHPGSSQSANVTWRGFTSSDNSSQLVIFTPSNGDFLRHWHGCECQEINPVVKDAECSTGQREREVNTGGCDYSHLETSHPG